MWFGRLDKRVVLFLQQRQTYDVYLETRILVAVWKLLEIYGKQHSENTFQCRYNWENWIIQASIWSKPQRIYTLGAKNDLSVSKGAVQIKIEYQRQQSHFLL